jgi:hypothetical protein
VGNLRCGQFVPGFYVHEHGLEQWKAAPMIVARGLGQTEDAGLDLPGVLTSPIDLGSAGTLPLWGVGAVLVLGYIFLRSVERKGRHVGQRISGRARKIKRGFTA